MFPTYAGFNRSRAECDILFHPYFVKRTSNGGIWWTARENRRHTHIRPRPRERDEADEQELHYARRSRPVAVFRQHHRHHPRKLPPRIVKIRATPPAGEILPARSSSPPFAAGGDSRQLFDFHLQAQTELMSLCMSFRIWLRCDGACSRKSCRLW